MGQKLLKYNEYLAFDKFDKIDQRFELMKEFRQQKKNLDEEIDKFLAKFPNLTEFNQQSLHEEEQLKTPNWPNHQMVVACKKFMIYLFGYLKPGWYLDIFDFAENDPNRLGKIYRTSKIHNILLGNKFL